MDKLYNFLKVLEENKVVKSYQRLRDGLGYLKVSLSNVDEEVKDIIMTLAIDGKYDEISEFTKLPLMSKGIVSNIEAVLNGEYVPDAIKPELSNNGVRTGLIVKNSKQVEHQDYGIGTIVGVIAQKDSNLKLLRVMFDCGEKQFECSDDVLVNNFGIDLSNLKDSSDIKSGSSVESNNLININDLEIGMVVRHIPPIPSKSFGIGRVVNIENRDNSNIKLVTVLFDCGEKTFQGNNYTLSTYFEIVSDTSFMNNEFIKSDELLLNNNECVYISKENTKTNTSELNNESVSINSDEGYSLYTNPEFFIGKKPLKVRIFDEEKEVETWTDLCLELYDYLLAMNKRVFYEVTDEIQGFGSLSQFMSNPIQIRRDLYFNRAGTKGMIKQMYYVSEKFSKHIEQDICENVRLFIK